jgi:O-antigen ligase
MSRAAGVCRNISLVLAGCLPFLVPFDPARNIDMQGILLIVSGAFAWCALLVEHRKIFGRLGRLNSLLLAIFATCCLTSLSVNPHLSYDFFGAPYIRLGTTGFLACMGIGLLLTTVPGKQLLTWLYLIIIGLSVVAVPYSWGQMHSLSRIGGLFAQSDIMACFAGVGLVLGLEMIRLYPLKRQLLVGLQVFLLALLLLTKTRAVLFLVLALGLIWLWQRRRGSFKPLIIYVVTAVLLLVVSHYLVPSRLTSASYASQSIHYRLTLQNYALKASWHRPVWGYGPGNLADALACQKLQSPALQKTCHQGYFFNSSHNIFIDRFLAVGWLGGLAFLALAVLAIYKALRAQPEVRIVGWALLLIACYYLTNVTNVTLELLLWVLILRGLYSKAK